MQEILLKTPTATERIFVGDGAAKSRIPALLAGQKNFVVTDDTVYRLHADFFNAYFAGTPVFVLPSGEENKNMQSLQAILQKMVEAGLHRSSRLFAVGGGVVGDIGGLAAALYMRGISCVQVPTTLLAQVDSAIGGKTAIDFGNVKNVVGAFHHPIEVIVDPLFLRTLPAREIKCGYGEIVKYAALSGEIFDMLEGETPLTELITACIAHKARVVAADEKESGERKSLNVGHTTGHMIELVHGLSHGESVLYGMLLETQIAINAGVCEKAYGERLLKIIRDALALLPLSSPDFSKIEVDAERARMDKKNISDKEIVLAVAKNKGAWTTYSLPFEAYCTALQTAVRGC